MESSSSPTKSTNKKCVFCGEHRMTFSDLYAHEPICLAGRAKKNEGPIERTLTHNALEIYLQHRIALALANASLSAELFQYARLWGTCRSLRRACENLIFSSQHVWEDACMRLQRSGLAMRKENSNQIVPIYDEKTKIVSGGDWRRAFVTEIQSLRRFGFPTAKLEHYLRRDPEEGQLDSEMRVMYSPKVQPREFYTGHTWKMDYGKVFAYVKRVFIHVTISLLEDSRAFYEEEFCSGQKMRWYEYTKRAEGTWNLTESGVELSLLMTVDTERSRDEPLKEWTLFIPVLKFSHLPGYSNDTGKFRRLYYRPLFVYDGENPYAYDLLT